MAEMDTADINDLPDSDFAYIEPGGEKDSEGKTTPRSLRHFPIHDAAHVRNALARASQSEFGAKAMPAIKAAAKKFGIDVADGKADLGELKAEPLDGTRLDRWLEGKIPRRILMLPFGGSIPEEQFGYAHDGKGRDLDGEYFWEGTDVYGPFPGLRQSRERLTDWHHDDDPTKVMKGAILGRTVFDEKPEAEGYWADFWMNAGEKRAALFAHMEQQGAKLYSSTQSVKGVRQMWPPTADGRIDIWPVIRNTISTSPQNRLAVWPSLKALLRGDYPSDALSVPALKAALTKADIATLTSTVTSSDGSATSRQASERSSKAGGGTKKKKRLAQQIGLVEEFLQEHRARIAALTSGDTPSE